MPRALCCFLCRVRLHDGWGVKGAKRDRGPDALPRLLRTRLLVRGACEALVWGKAAERGAFLVWEKYDPVFTKSCAVR